MNVRIGTRGSDLALWQARHVAARLGAAGAQTELVIIQTQGDTIDNKPLQSVAGSSFFTAELERALLDQQVDLAVHSFKDLAIQMPEGLTLAAVPERACPLERLLVRSQAYTARGALLPLIAEASVGTSAPRRRALIETLRPDLAVTDLRGNVPTRVRRLREGRYDAVILAAAGLDRLELDLSGLQAVDLPAALAVPAPAQGALAVQIRGEDAELEDLCVRVLHDASSAACVAAERSLLAHLGGGCHLPVGALVVPAGTDAYHAHAFLGPGVRADIEGARWSEGWGDSPAAAMQVAQSLLLGPQPTQVGPLAGLRVALSGTSSQGTTLGARLTELGAAPLHEPVLAVQDLGAPDLPAKLARLKAGDALAVTSQETARRLADEQVPAGVAVAAVGPATAKALAAVGIHADVIGKGGARELAERLEVRPEGRVLFPCSDNARPDLPAALAARGIRVDKVVLYKVVSEASSPAAEDVQARVYMSPSSVVACVALGREHGRGPVPSTGSSSVEDVVVRVGLGGSTCDALQDQGLDHERPNGSGPEAVVRLLSRLARRPAPEASV